MGLEIWRDRCSDEKEQARSAWLSTDAIFPIEEAIWLSTDTIPSAAQLSSPLLSNCAEANERCRLQTESTNADSAYCSEDNGKEVDWEQSVWIGGSTTFNKAFMKKERMKYKPLLLRVHYPAVNAEDAPSGTENEPLMLAKQVFPVFILAGIGMVAAGLLLATVRKWSVFKEVREILILVPALLGLKGNLEMTLASRLSTHANLGHLDDSRQCYRIIVGNLSVVQCQAIVVGLLASLVAVGMNFLTVGTLELSHVLLLASSAVTAASIASFTLAVVMVALVLVSHHYGVDPDNVAAPIAGMLGDCVTLVLISGIAQLLWQDFDDNMWIQVAILAGYCVLLPMCMWVSCKNEHASVVLREGWTPVILAMLISSLGGIILKHSDMVFPHLAPFAPVTNGAGGNLAAVQASRISTDLHCQGEPGDAIQLDGASTQSTPSIPDQLPSFPVTKDRHEQAGMTLVLLVVPGALFFVTMIVFVISQGHALPSKLFLLIYIAAVVVQARVLVLAARALVVGLWQRGIDPDNGAIPYVTALGDVVGTAALTAAFYVLQDLLGAEPWSGAL